MTLDLTDDEARAFAKHLRRTLNGDPFTFTPQLDPLKAILAKLELPLSLASDRSYNRERAVYV